MTDSSKAMKLLNWTCIGGECSIDDSAAGITEDMVATRSGGEAAALRGTELRRRRV